MAFIFLFLKILGNLGVNKVQIIWGCHTNLKKYPTLFWRFYVIFFKVVYVFKLCGLLTIIIVKFNYLKNLVYICAWLCEINILYLTRRTMSSQTLRQEFMHVSWRTMAGIPTFCPKITWPFTYWIMIHYANKGSFLSGKDKK